MKQERTTLTPDSTVMKFPKETIVTTVVLVTIQLIVLGIVIFS